MFLVFAFGAADRLYVLLGLGYSTQLTIFRIAVFVAPVIVFRLTRRICRDLQAAGRVEATQEEAEEEAAQEQAVLASRVAG